MKRKLIALALFNLAMVNSYAFAGEDNTGSYLTDSRGQVVKTGSGLCVHTSAWKRGDSIQGCDVTDSITLVEQPNTTPVDTTERTIAEIEATAKEEVISADLLFRFNKYNLTSEGKATLDTLVNNNSPQNSQTVIVIGYADPIGSDEYNERLSTRRAKSVQDYLVSKGFSLDTIQSEGRGETNLKISQEDCKGKNVIACLAPNRRVEITIKK